MILPVREGKRRIRDSVESKARIETFLYLDQSFDLMGNAGDFLHAILKGAVNMPTKIQRWEVDVKKLKEMGHDVEIIQESNQKEAK